MKWIWLLFIPVVAFGQSQELLRPTVDIDGSSSVAIALDSADCTGAAYGGSITLPNWYDSGGLSTSTIFNLNNNSTTQTRCADRVFKTWATTTNTYTALTLNVNTSGACSSNCGQGTLAYSTNGGSTWTQIRQSNGWVQTTDTITLSASQDLTKLQVAVNDFAFNNVPSGAGQGNMAVTGFDVWTVGTYSAATPTPTPNVAPPPVKAKHPTVISWLMDELNRMSFVINFDNLEIAQEVSPENAIAFDSEAIREVTHTEYGDGLIKCRLTDLDSYITPQRTPSHDMESDGRPQIASNTNPQSISRNHGSSGPGIHNQVKRFAIHLKRDQHQTVSLLEGQLCLPKRRADENQRQKPLNHKYPAFLFLEPTIPIADSKRYCTNHSKNDQFRKANSSAHHYS